MLLVGGGAAEPTLAGRIATRLGAAVRAATTPRLAAVRGAALAALRRTAAREPEHTRL